MGSDRLLQFHLLTLCTPPPPAPPKSVEEDDDGQREEGRLSDLRGRGGSNNSTGGAHQDENRSSSTLHSFIYLAVYSFIVQNGPTSCLLVDHEDSPHPGGPQPRCRGQHYSWVGYNIKLHFQELFITNTKIVGIVLI